MRSSLLYTSALAIGAAILLAPLGNYALPTGVQLISRAPLGWSVAHLIVAVIEYLKDANAYDPGVPDKCIMKMGTSMGAGCSVNIICDGDGTLGYGRNLPPWNVCYLGGRQFLNHPSLGDFSITWTKAGGVDGDNEDGLHDPVLQMANLNDWEPFDIQKIINDQGDRKTGKLCTKKPGMDASVTYTCGLPMTGRAGFGMSNFPPVSDQPGFEPGWCTMHVVQHQRNQYGIGNDYAFDVVIFDNAKKQIGKVQLAAIDAGSKSLSVTSQLPYTVEVIAAGDDDAPVVFKYGDQTWQSGDGTHQSTFGDGPEKGFEDGNREGDMGFTC